MALADAAAPLDQHMLLADDCFIKTNTGVADAGEQFATTLVGVDRDPGEAAAMSLPSTEATPLATEFVASFIDRCGLTRVTLRTDGEPAMTSLADKVKDRREHGAILQQAPKHSSASMGVVERAHWEVHSQTRTMTSQLAGACQTTIMDHKPVDRQAQRLAHEPLPRQGDWHDRLRRRLRRGVPQEDHSLRRDHHD